MEKFIKYLSIGIWIWLICMLSGGWITVFMAMPIGAFIWWLIRMNQIWDHNALYEKAGLKTREVLRNPSTLKEIAEAKKAPIPPACNEAYLSQNRLYWVRKKDTYKPKVIPSCWYDYLKLDPVEHVNAYIVPASSPVKKNQTRWRQKANEIYQQLINQSPNWDQRKNDIFKKKMDELIEQDKKITNEEWDEIAYQAYKTIESQYRIWMYCRFDYYLKENNFFGRLRVDFYYKARNEFVENGKCDVWGEPVLMWRTAKFEERLAKEREEKRNEVDRGCEED